MAKSTHPDKGKSISTYRNEKVPTGWQQELFDRLHALFEEVHPSIKSSIKWAQPVFETAEGPLAFMRSASKHFTLGFWRGAELDDPTAVLEGEGDRMKHLKFKSAEFDTALVTGFIHQAIALNAQKGDPTKGK